jgi:hypothetical protein
VLTLQNVLFVGWEAQKIIELLNMEYINILFPHPKRLFCPCIKSSNNIFPFFFWCKRFFNQHNNQAILIGVGYSALDLCSKYKCSTRRALDEHLYLN